MARGGARSTRCRGSREQEAPMARPDPPTRARRTEAPWWKPIDAPARSLSSADRPSAGQICEDRRAVGELAGVGEPKLERRRVDIFEQVLASADDHGHDPQPELVDEVGTQE